MSQTRAALADKIDALEYKVTSRVEAVKAKVDDVRDSIREGTAKVKRGFDLPYQVRQHPWPALGASVVVGLVLGSLTGDHDDDRPRTDEFESGFERRNRQTGHDDSRRGPAKAGMFSDEFRSLKQAAVGAIMSLVRNSLRQTFPGVATQTDRAVDGITRKLGGEPVENVFEAPAS
jgi:ElaB/YqjD/DUF883 family membrane-anchored ribosome-binding protein